MPEDISNVNDVILIRELQEKGSIDPTDLYLLQTTNQSYKLSHDNLVAALPDNSTIEVDPISNKLKVSDNFLKVDIDLFDGVDQSHGELASSKAIKDYVDAIETGSGTSVFVPIDVINKFNQNDGQIITYDVTNFTSPDSSFTSSRVTGVYLECYTSKDGNGHNFITSIESQLGNTSTWVTVQKTYDYEDSTTGGLKFIPLSLGQTTFNLRLVGASGEIDALTGERGWRIVGVSQSTSEIVQIPSVNTTLFRYGEIQFGNIDGTPTGSLTTTGDFTANKVNDSSGASTVTCTFTKPLQTDKYNLLFETISLGNLEYDQDIKEIVVLSKSSTGFEFNLEETDTNTQNLQINVRVESNIPNDRGQLIETDATFTTATFTGAITQYGPGIDEDNRNQQNTFTWSDITLSSFVDLSKPFDEITHIIIHAGLNVTGTGQGTYSSTGVSYELSLDNGTTWEYYSVTNTMPYKQYANGFYPTIHEEIRIPNGLTDNEPIAIRVKVTSDNTDNNERVRNYGTIKGVVGL